VCYLIFYWKQIKPTGQCFKDNKNPCNHCVVRLTGPLKYFNILIIYSSCTTGLSIQVIVPILASGKFCDKFLISDYASRTLGQHLIVSPNRIYAVNLLYAMNHFHSSLRNKPNGSTDLLLRETFQETLRFSPGNALRL